MSLPRFMWRKPIGLVLHYQNGRGCQQVETMTGIGWGWLFIGFVRVSDDAEGWIYWRDKEDGSGVEQIWIQVDPRLPWNLELVDDPLRRKNMPCTPCRLKAYQRMVGVEKTGITQDVVVVNRTGTK